MPWFLLVISLVLVFAAAAHADPSPMPETVTPRAPSGGVKRPKSQPVDRERNTATMSPAEIREKADTYYKQCMKDWDAATHMTKQEWQRTCRRITDERVKFMVEQMGK